MFRVEGVAVKIIRFEALKTEEYLFQGPYNEENSRGCKCMSINPAQLMAGTRTLIFGKSTDWAEIARFFHD